MTQLRIRICYVNYTFVWERYENDMTQYIYKANHEPSYPVTCISIARQQSGKHFSATHEHTTTVPPLLGNG
jgi:hypothetical protein